MAEYHIVIDTNVVVAAMRSNRGASNALLERLNDRRITVHVSNTLLFEYEEVLNREQTMLGLSAKQIADLLDGFCHMAEKHYVPFLWRPAVRDPDDDFLIDLAVSARATHLITHNLDDLETAGEHFRISVVTPGRFLAILRAE